MTNISKCDLIYEDAYLDIVPKEGASPAGIIEEAIHRCIEKRVRKAYITFNTKELCDVVYTLDLDEVVKTIMKNKRKVESNE